MILDAEDQRKLLITILSEHVFRLQGKDLVSVANEFSTLAKAITDATLAEEDDGPSHTQETPEEAQAEED